MSAAISSPELSSGGMSNTRHGRCWYCGESVLETDDPPEHIIPAALGGTLTTDRVCRACNQRAGREIDWPFQNDWMVAQNKLAHKVQHATKSGPGSGRTGRAQAHRKGDPGTVVDIDRDWKATVRGKIERTDGGGATIHAASEEEAKRLRERLVKQLAEEGREIQSESIATEKFDEVEINLSIDGGAWLRGAAKLVLGTLSLCADESWLDSDDAKRLQRWLWEKEPTDDAGAPVYTAPNPPGPHESLMAVPPTHLITVMPILGVPNRVVVSIGLFGSLYLRMGATLPALVPSSCWVVVPGQKPRPLTWAALLDEAVARSIEAAKSAGGEPAAGTEPTQ